MSMSQLADFYVRSYTTAVDTAFRVEDLPEVILASGNIHCYDNDAYYGNAYSSNDAIIRANACVWFDAPFRPYDLLFKNVTAGANTKIVITGTILKKKW